MLKDKINKIIGGGIAKKFIILTVAIIIIFDIVTGIFMQIDLDRTLSEDLNESGMLLAKHLSEEVSGTLAGENATDMNLLLENIMNSDNDVKYAFITDDNNNVIARTFPNDFQSLHTDNSSVSGGTNVIDIKAPILAGGFVHVGMDKTLITNKINNQTRLIIGNILTEGLLGVLMAYAAGYYLTKPIRSLVKGAQEIGSGNLGYKIETGSSDDEIRTLSNAFNQMSHNLDKSISELRQLSTAVEEAPDGIQITDLNGYVIYSNRAIEEIYGFSPDEFKGKHVSEMNVDPELARRIMVPAVNKTGRWTGELMVRHKDGREFPIWLTVSIVKGSKGDPIAMVGIIRDITGQKEKEKLEKQLLQADKLATVGQLAAGVAHEINNPLGNISLYTQMLLKKTEDKAIKDKLTIINDEADRAAQIVKGLLDFARQSELRKSQIDINKEIGKVLGILKPQLKDIRVETDLEPVPLILADSGQMQQVLMNLFTNSIQSITENGEIMVKTKATQNHVEISISDNGCGIPAEKLNRVFDPFFTTKEQGKGTGLGLSISYGIIKRHSGSIEVKSRAGKGATFTIKLPV